MNAFGLKTIPRPCDQPGSHTVLDNFDPVIQLPDCAVRSNFVKGAKAGAPFFVNHKILRAHRVTPPRV
jgi:hypothetical protein